MLKLFKYLKPYLAMILVTIVLLFIQANAELALPDYLSRIVNVGIQQGGVENAAPVAVRQSQMTHMLAFLDAADQTRLLADYTLVDQSSLDYAAQLAVYPALENEPVYILKDVDETELEWLNSKAGQALLVVSGLEQMLADPAQAAAMGQNLGFDLTMLPPGTDIYTMLGQLPAEQRAQISAAIEQQFAALGESMVNQAAIRATRAEYTALGMDPGQFQNAYIFKTGGWMLLISLVTVICAVGVSYFASRSAAGFARDLRKSVFQRVETFSSAEFNKFSTASLITRTTNDITQVQMFVLMTMRMIFFAPIMGVGGIIRAMSKGSSMWWIIAVAVAVLLSLIVVVFSLSLPKFKIMQSLIDRLNLVMRENLSGMMVIRAFNTQQIELNRFDKANVNLTDVNLFVSRVMATMFPAMMLIMNGLSILIIWVGAHQVAQATMQVGDMMAFLQYAMQIVFSFLMMSFMFIILPRASVSANRIADVLDTIPTINDPETPQTFAQPFRGVVEFQNVSFRYPGADEDVLHDISFTAYPCQTTAFIGSTGSGKSTIINLIPRFYDVTDGAILLDGVDIRTVTQHDLRNFVGYIPQQSTLFSGTIESNLRYADEHASQETLEQAVEIAQAAEIIAAKPEGWQTEIAQGGVNVSGGQKQRLSIARALVKNAPIYIFDDSFSALDFKTDAALRRALNEKSGCSTLLIVTQRVSTIIHADQIIVLDEGKIVGKGTHSELMTSCETYREIALSQLSMEELS